MLGVLSTAASVTQREQIAQIAGAKEAALSRVVQHALGKVLLVHLSVVDLLLDGARGDEAINGHGAGLTQTPRALPGLELVWVWVWVGVGVGDRG